MKHCVFFSLMAMLLLSACVKHDEIEFAGTVIDVRMCSSSYTEFNAGGFLVQLDYPEGVGSDIVTEEGDSAKNLIVLYEPTTRIKIDNHIHGSFYLDNNYSKANCSWRYNDYELQEGVFTETVVDK